MPRAVGRALATRHAPSPVQQKREAYLRVRARRSAAVAAISTVVVGVLALVVIGRSSGWPRVRESFFNYHDARASFPAVLRGMWLNIRVLVVAEVFIIIVALIVAGIRTLRGPVWFPLRVLATVYTDVFRGIPLIIVLYLVGFGVPGLQLSWVPNRHIAVLGTFALVLTYGAYVAEVFRAGIESVHPSQRAAARSLGLTHYQTFRLVVLPQAIRRVFPPLLNDFVALQKDVGLISVLGAIDAIRAAQIAQYNTAGFTPYVVAGLLFIILAVPSVRLADWVAARAGRREQSRGVV